MAFTVTDLFTGPTGTELTAHAPDLPSTAAWIRQTTTTVSTFDLFAGGGYGGILEVKDDNIGSNGVLHWLDFDVGVDAIARMGPKLVGPYNPAGEGAGKFGDVGVAARLSWDGTSLQAGDLKTVSAYIAMYRYSNHTWYIIKYDVNTDVPGNPSQRRATLASIAASSSPAPPLAIADAQRYFDFEVTGTNPVQLSIKEGSTVILSTTDNSGTQITSGAKVGVYMKAPNGNPPYMNEFYAGPAAASTNVVISCTKADANATGLSATVSSSGAVVISCTKASANATGLSATVTNYITTDVITNNTGSPLVSTSMNWTWIAGGRIGSLTGLSVVEGTTSTDDAGKLTPPVNKAAGVLLVSSRVTNATDDFVFYQAFQ